MGIGALDGLVHGGGIMADHVGRLKDQVEALGGHAARQWLHAHEHFGDEVGQPLDDGHLPVVRIGRRADDIDLEHAAQEGGDASGRTPSNGAPGNAMAGDTVVTAARR